MDNFLPLSSYYIHSYNFLFPVNNLGLSLDIFKNRFPIDYNFILY